MCVGDELCTQTAYHFLATLTLPVNTTDIPLAQAAGLSGCRYTITTQESISLHLSMGFEELAAYIQLTFS